MLELANMDLHIISDFDHQLEPKVCISISTQINLNVFFFDDTSLFWQVLADMSEMGIPMFIHGIAFLKHSTVEELCPIFAHSKIDPERDVHLFQDHVYVPADKLFSR